MPKIEFAMAARKLDQKFMESIVQNPVFNLSRVCQTKTNNTKSGTAYR